MTLRGLKKRDVWSSNLARMRLTRDRILEKAKSLLSNVHCGAAHRTKLTLILLYWFMLKTTPKGNCYFYIINEGTETRNFGAGPK